jgi:hypothetical protein
MSLLKKAGGGAGFLKAGLLGFGGSGKTFTAKELAIGVREFFKLTGPIAMQDTEAGSEYIAADVKKRTGKEMLSCCSRSFDDLIGLTQECPKAKVSVLIVDSITHIWRDLTASYLNKINKKRIDKGHGIRSNLTFADWAPIKDYWNDKWTSWYLNSPMHVIICGRAGFDWDFRENEDTGKEELIKTGVKMKTESEFGFEPSLLVEMTTVQKLVSGKPTKILRRATVLKDRFGIIDGQQGDNPGFDFFKPHVAMLTPGALSPVDTEARSDVPVDDDGWGKEKRQRTILCEEIQGEITALYPGMTKEEKKAKADLLHKVFKTRSWTKVESLPSDVLRPALARVRTEIGKAQAVAS